MKTLSMILIVTVLSLSSRGQLKFVNTFSPKIDSSDMAFSKLVKEKKLDEALALLDKYIQTDSTVGIYYFNRAVINYRKKVLAKYFSMGISDVIYNDCKKALDNNYDTPELHYLIFSQFSQTDRIFEFVTPYIIENGVETPVDYEKAKEQIDLAIEKYPKKNVKYLFARMIFFYKKLYGQQALSEISSSNNENTEIEFPEKTRFKFDCIIVIEETKDKFKKAAANYFLSQISYILDKDTIAAIQHLSEAIDVDTSVVAYYSERANLKYKTSNYKGAISDFNKYLAKEKSWEDFKTRGNCYSLIGNEKTAIADYTTAIVLLNKQLIHAKNGKGYSTINSIKMYLGQIHYFRGVSYLELNNKSNACSDLNKAIELGYKNAQEIITESCQ